MDNKEAESTFKKINNNQEKLRSKLTHILSKVHALEKKVSDLENQAIQEVTFKTNIMNNKFVKIAIVALILVGGLLLYKNVNAAELQGSFSAGYNSELQFRGVSQGEENIQGALNTSVTLGDFDVGFNVLANNRDGEDEFRVGVDTSVDLIDGVESSFGIVNYSANHLVGDSTELYTELGVDTFLKPSVKVYYNIDDAFATLEGSVSHDIEVWKNYNLTLSAGVGNTEIQEERFSYYGADALVTKSISENTSLYVGVNFTTLQNTPSEDDVTSVFVGVHRAF